MDADMYGMTVRGRTIYYCDLEYFFSFFAEKADSHCNRTITLYHLEEKNIL
jgi:hypothetical protein